MEAAEHDGLAAGVSHLPVALAAAMMSTLAASPGGVDLRRIAGGALREATGRSGGSEASQADVCLTNAEGMLRWLDAFRVELDGLADLIRAGDAAPLVEYFERAHAERERWFPTAPPEKAKPPRLFGRG
jgi:prephenate dehydrogenase